MLPVVIGVTISALAIIGFLWYNARKSANAESTADAEKTARVEADRRTEALERARLETEAKARLKDANEGSEIVSRGDTGAARDRLVRSFPGSKASRKP